MTEQLDTIKTRSNQIIGFTLIIALGLVLFAFFKINTKAALSLFLFITAGALYHAYTNFKLLDMWKNFKGKKGIQEQFMISIMIMLVIAGVLLLVF